MLKCSKSTISLYETGDTVPDAKNIVRLCDIFGVSCDYLLCQTNYRRAEDERLTIEEMGIRRRRRRHSTTWTSSNCSITADT